MRKLIIGNIVRSMHVMLITLSISMIFFISCDGPQGSIPSVPDGVTGETATYNCAVKYPIIGSHGLTDNGEPEYAYGMGGSLDDGTHIDNKGWWFHGFNSIPETLEANGLPKGWFTVPDKDTFVSIPVRAGQLREHILYILDKTSPKIDPERGWVDNDGNLWKVNIIGHCQGGHDAIYLASENCFLTDGWGIPMYKRIASITTLSSAHSGHVYFDVLYWFLSTGEWPSWLSSMEDLINDLQDYVAQNQEYDIEIADGEQGDDLVQSFYYLTTGFLRDFKKAYPPSPDVYVQGFGAKIMNIFAEQFNSNNTPSDSNYLSYEIIKGYYNIIPEIDSDNDSITHPLEAAAQYYDFDAGTIKTVEGMENFHYRATLSGAGWSDGVSHKYILDSSRCYAKTINSSDVPPEISEQLSPAKPDLLWIPNSDEPDEPQVGFSAKLFYKQLVDDLRRMGF